jgi:hypothetical protein
MAKQFYGISALTQNYAKTTNIADVDKEIVPVRVLDIILDDSHPEFEKYGGWNGVGTIFYDTIGVPSGLDNINTATPLSSITKTYPLVNELVPLVFLTSTDSQLNTSRTTAYYLPPINLWNSQHHNALPDSTGEGFDTNTLQDYQQAEQGNPKNVRRVNDGATDIDLGEGFNEKIDIHPLQAYIGDNIFEGRWGNSIRLGSTVKDKNNEWSAEGENGDPLTIIRNGQRDGIEEDPWVPIPEQINNDKASIYLASGQKLPIEISSEDYDSYAENATPTAPKEFVGDQIVMNSNRLVLNAKNDHIFIVGKQSVNLKSPTAVNIDTSKVIINSTAIFLGDKDATEPVLLGDQTVEVLSDFMRELSKWMEIFNLVPLDELSAQASTAEQLSFIIKNEIIPALENRCRSKQNFTV